MPPPQQGLATSQEQPAAALTGAELVRLVQSNLNVRATLTQIIALATGAQINPRVITAPGAVVVAPTDTFIVLNKGASSATPMQLPTVASRGGLVLTIVDFVGNAGPITITPLSESIMGMSAGSPWTVVYPGGAGTGGRINLAPILGLGWVVFSP